MSYSVTASSPPAHLLLLPQPCYNLLGAWGYFERDVGKGPYTPVSQLPGPSVADHRAAVCGQSAGCARQGGMRNRLVGGVQAENPVDVRGGSPLPGVRGVTVERFLWVWVGAECWGFRSSCGVSSLQVLLILLTILLLFI